MNNAVDQRPLYSRVRDTLIERIRSGVWKPGAMIPNEFEVAADLEVSQGTARKAIDSLAAEGILVRRQGKGTFVVEHTPQNVLFRFFHVYDEAGNQALPDCPSVRPRVVSASAAQAAALAIDVGSTVIQIDRDRSISGRPFSVETIALPEPLFAGMAKLASVPNTLYDMYQKDYGVLVGRADDKLTAIAASRTDAELLQVAPGAPLLQIDRVTYDIDGRPIEWRVSRCHLDGMHYLSRLR